MAKSSKRSSGSRRPRKLGMHPHGNNPNPGHVELSSSWPTTGLMVGRKSGIEKQLKRIAGTANLNNAIYNFNRALEAQGIRGYIVLHPTLDDLGQRCFALKVYTDSCLKGERATPYHVSITTRKGKLADGSWVNRAWELLKNNGPKVKKPKGVSRKAPVWARAKREEARQTESKVTVCRVRLKR